MFHWLTQVICPQRSLEVPGGAEVAMSEAWCEASRDQIAEAMEFTTEKDLTGRRFSGPYKIFNANQYLVQQGIARKARTHLVEFMDFDGINQSTKDCVAALMKKKTQGVVSLSESWTDEAVRYLRREKHTDRAVKLAALNYANCTYVGGNYSDGGMVRAQEEELHRLFPALFESMKTCPAAGSVDGDMCRYKQHVFGAVFGDGYSKAKNVLFTEEVQCMRGPSDISYRLLHDEANQVSCGFVAAAAPLFNRGRDADFAEWRRQPKETYEKTFLNVFWAPKSVDPSYDVIVIGPWGCGAFGNDPYVVAQSFINVILEHDLLHRFKEIHFCLGRSVKVDNTVGGRCNINVDAFRSALQKLHQDSNIDVLDYTQDLQEKADRWLNDEARE
eukprot:gnl/MRDRNA2_/MRDRNA2_114803_c0_seq1.p1 gnl/MRDRNA2_/MRDRNA2_114803_c0~~gnl/MRDRNA2_/MRDRNA2_114803_c0_seq1.p1  ORF type:complete len:387 (-),score=73.10 gnl/MRDRNA2_/MRDRNA2_114803_c0_seq1:83-1243(-)